jgi:hypothetical protein
VDWVSSLIFLFSPSFLAASCFNNNSSKISVQPNYGISFTDIQQVQCDNPTAWNHKEITNMSKPTLMDEFVVGVCGESGILLGVFEGDN